MKHNIPRTPFSTRLSDSCRETELRIRNILSGPKKRPPLPLIILIAALCLFCGNLVSCHVTKPPEAPVIVMETQYYDRYDNLVEIPALALPAGAENEAVDSINAALNTLREEYAFAQHSIAGDNKCLFYPSTTDRHLNLLFFEDYFKTDLNTGHVFSLVYDLKEGTVVSTQDALALAGLNEKGLLEQVDGLVQARLDLNSQELGFPLALHNLTLEGFRIRADGQPVFYLTGREDDADDSLRDGVSGADQLYIWEDRAVTTYNRYSGDSSPLVPAGETDKLDPPLWCRWFFAGEEPAGGFVDKSLLEPAADLYDPEVCLYRDGYSTPIGPGNWAELFPEFEPEVEIFESWRTDPQAGHVESWSIDGGGEEGGVSAERFYDAEADRWHIYRMETGRSDMYTPRGIRVGATREEVLAAYPGLLSDEKNWQWAYPDDYLWYCANENGLGPYLYFFFTDDVVYMIQMGIQYKY